MSSSVQPSVASGAEGHTGRARAMHRILDLWLGAPLLLVISLFRRRRALAQMPRSIGVFSPSAIGDLILGSGMLVHLRRAFPDATIHLFHGPNNAGCVPLLPTDVRAHRCDFTAFIETLSAIRRAQLELVVDLTPWPRLTAIYAALSGASTIGFRSARQFRHFAFDVAVPHLRSRHELDNLHALARRIAPCDDYRPSLRVESAEAVTARSLPYERLILCHISPGGSRAHDKKWPDERWVELVRRLADDGFATGFTGASGDEAAVEAVLRAANLLPSAAFSLCGSLSLRELAQVLRAARLLITVDTGILHLASALEVPLVALHGPTRSWRWGARSNVAISLDAAHVGAGYIHLGFERHPLAAEIMKTISVDLVHEAARRAIGAATQASAPGAPGSAKRLF